MDACRICKEEKETLCFSKAQKRKYKKGCRVCIVCAEKLAESPSRASGSSWYSIKKTEGRTEVIATRNFTEREVIAKEKPMFEMASPETVKELLAKHNIKISNQWFKLAMGTLLPFSELPVKKRKLALDITIPGEVPDKKLRLVYRKAAKIAVKLWGGTEENYKTILRIVFYKALMLNDKLVLFLGSSQMRHACQPNVVVNLKKNPGFATVFSTEKISAGDELFVAWQTCFGPCFVRQMQLYRKFHFICECTRGPNPCSTGPDLSRGLPCPNCCVNKKSVKRSERIGLDDGLIFPDQAKLSFEVDGDSRLCCKQADPEIPAWVCTKCGEGFKNVESREEETTRNILELEVRGTIEVFQLGEQGIDPSSLSAEDLNLRRSTALTMFGPWHFITIKWDTLLLKGLYETESLTTAGLPNAMLAEIIVKRLEEFADLQKQPVEELFPEEIRMVSEIYRGCSKMKGNMVKGNMYKADKYKTLYESRLCE